MGASCRSGRLEFRYGEKVQQHLTRSSSSTSRAVYKSSQLMSATRTWSQGLRLASLSLSPSFHLSSITRRYLTFFYADAKLYCLGPLHNGVNNLPNVAITNWSGVTNGAVTDSVTLYFSSKSDDLFFLFLVIVLQTDDFLVMSPCPPLSAFQ